jgi:hypothetical protein
MYSGPAARSPESRAWSSVWLNTWEAPGSGSGPSRRGQRAVHGDAASFQKDQKPLERSPLLLQVPHGKILAGQMLKIRLTVAGGHLGPAAAALGLQKGGKTPQVLLPGLPIGDGQVGVLLQMLKELLQDVVHARGIFLNFLFHYTLKYRKGILEERPCLLNGAGPKAAWL